MFNDLRRKMKKNHKHKLAIQTLPLNKNMTYSKMIFITQELIVKNLTGKDIYFYSILQEDGSLYYNQSVRDKEIKSIKYLKNSFDFFRISYEDKSDSESKFYSCIIKFEQPGEFWFKLFDRDREYILLSCRIFELYGFFLVVIKERISNYPYYISNFSDVDLLYKQIIPNNNILKEFSSKKYCKC